MQEKSGQLRMTTLRALRSLMKPIAETRVSRTTVRSPFLTFDYAGGEMLVFRVPSVSLAT